MRIALLALALLAACKSESQRGYERLAERVNPLVVALRPVAAQALAIPTTFIREYDGCVKSDKTLIAQCVQNPRPAIIERGACKADDTDCVRRACETAVFYECMHRVCAASEAELAQLSAIDHAACTPPPAELLQLESMHFDEDDDDRDRDFDPKTSSSPAFDAHFLLETTRVGCIDDGAPPNTDFLRCSRIHRCSWRCLEGWQALVVDFRALHDRAAKHGVETEVLVRP